MITIKHYFFGLGISVAILIFAGCGTINTSADMFHPQTPPSQGATAHKTSYKQATFAGGCFWCIESAFEHYDGVVEAISGYTGGHETKPTYEEVSAGGTGHRESVRVIYDPAKISYSDLLEIFWRQIDPTDNGGSFVDRGDQYTSAIFYHSKKQKELAVASKTKMQDSGRYDQKIVTQILPGGRFYPAEEYHQDYYKKKPIAYKIYRFGSGRDQYRKKTWGADRDYHLGGEDDVQEGAALPHMPGANFQKPPLDKLRSILTPLQYKVTQQDGTERAYNNEYWDNHEDGIYVDIVSGEPLFSSTDKFNSGTGWPSFTRALEPDNMIEKKDRKFFMTRTELRSKGADSHLGHLFDDGPEPTGLRYCINSAALKFIPRTDLKKYGYSKYQKLFK